MERTGWSLTDDVTRPCRNRISPATTPSAALRVATPTFLDAAATPPHQEGIIADASVPQLQTETPPSALIRLPFPSLYLNFTMQRGKTTSLLTALLVADAGRTSGKWL